MNISTITGFRSRVLGQVGMGSGYKDDYCVIKYVGLAKALLGSAHPLSLRHHMN